MNLVTLGLQEPGLLQGMILLPLGLCANYYTNKQSTYKKDPSQEFQGKRSTIQPDFKKFGPLGHLGFTLQRFIQGLLKRLRSFSSLRQRRRSDSSSHGFDLIRSCSQMVDPYM